MDLTFAQKTVIRDMIIQGWSASTMALVSDRIDAGTFGLSASEMFSLFSKLNRNGGFWWDDRLMELATQVMISDLSIGMVEMLFTHQIPAVLRSWGNR